MKENISIFSFDAITNNDIEKIVSIIYEKFEEALYVGTLGLLEALNKEIFKDYYRFEGSDKKDHNFKPINLKETGKDKEKCFGCVYIGFTSSKYEITKKQIYKLKNKKNPEIVKIKINDFLNIKDKKYISKIEDITDEIIKKPIKNGLFIVTEFRGKKEPEKLSELILKIISEISVNILKSIKFGRLILIGGETALNILRSFKVNNIKIMCRIIDGISYGIISDGILKGKEV